MMSASIRRVSILGCGLIGTSLGLALRRAGIQVALADRDPRAVATAEGRGAGVALTSRTPVADVVVVATPPSAVAGVLRDAQARGLGLAYTDVASAKRRILIEAERMGCDFSSYVPGHPMAGGEQQGPGAARADLFVGRRWILSPHPATPLWAVRRVTELVAACGARHRLLPADEHDRLAAVLSHTPHLVSAALAAGFADADPAMLALAGAGLRDTTRIAGGDTGLWCDILRQNAESVAAAVDAVVRELSAAASALRAPGGADTSVLADLLSRGNRGRARIVAASGGRPAAGHEQEIGEGVLAA